MERFHGSIATSLSTTEIDKVRAQYEKLGPVDATQLSSAREALQQASGRLVCFNKRGRHATEESVVSEEEFIRVVRQDIEGSLRGSQTMFEAREKARLALEALAAWADEATAPASDGESTTPAVEDVCVDAAESDSAAESTAAVQVNQSDSTRPKRAASAMSSEHRVLDCSAASSSPPNARARSAAGKRRRSEPGHKQKKRGFRLDSYTKRRLEAALAQYAAKDGKLTFEAVIAFRKALHEGAPPMIAGDSRSLMRASDPCHQGTVSTACLAKTLAKEVLKSGSQVAADAALARAEDAAPNIKQWQEPRPELIEELHTRAEELRQRGEPRAALGMFSRARVLWSRIPPFQRHRRFRFNLEHIAELQAAEQHDEAAVQEGGAVAAESPSATWPLPRGWQECRLPGAGRRYYHGEASGKSTYQRPTMGDWSEDLTAPPVLQCPAEQVEAECAGSTLVPFVVDHHGSFSQLARQASSRQYVLTAASSSEEVATALRLAVACGCTVNYLADGADAAERARVQFDAVHQGLFNAVLSKEVLVRDTYAAMLLGTATEQAVLGEASPSDTFTFVWVQRSMLLPPWAVKGMVSVLQVAAQPDTEQGKVAAARGKGWKGLSIETASLGTPVELSVAAASPSCA